MFSTRTWYLIATGILATGAVAAVVVQDWSAVVIFALLAALAFVLASKIERWERARHRSSRDE